MNECIMVKITNEDETMMTKLIATPFSVLVSKKKNSRFNILILLVCLSVCDEGFGGGGGRGR